MCTEYRHPDKINGLVAATFTPFLGNGKINLQQIPPYADLLQKKGVAGAFICGTTGEGPSLTVSERLQIAEAWVESAHRDLKVFVHVGHTSLTEAKRLASHAEKIGAHAVACIAPFFFKPRNIVELVDWCAAVAGAAPGLPFYYYHIPALTGLNLRMADMLPLVRERIPNFAGMKYTFEDLKDFAACLDYSGGRYEFLFGRDEILLTALKLGAKGAVGTTYNFTSSIFQRIIAAQNSGDVARAEELQGQATGLIDVCVKGQWHPIAAFKWLMLKVGLDCGPTRLPIANLTPEQVDLLEKRIEALMESGVLDERME